MWIRPEHPPRHESYPQRAAHRPLTRVLASLLLGLAVLAGPVAAMSLTAVVLSAVTAAPAAAEPTSGAPSGQATDTPLLPGPAEQPQPQTGPNRVPDAAPADLPTFGVVEPSTAIGLSALALASLLLAGVAMTTLAWMPR